MTFGLRIRVDFNRRSGDGSVIASLHRATGTISVGDVVIASQPGEEMEHFARVTSIDETTGRVALEVNWDSDPASWKRVSTPAEPSAAGPLLVQGGAWYRVTPVFSRAPFASGRDSARQPVGV